VTPLTRRDRDYQEKSSSRGIISAGGKSRRRAGGGGLPLKKQTLPDGGKKTTRCLGRVENVKRKEKCRGVGGGKGVKKGVLRTRLVCKELVSQRTRKTAQEYNAIPGGEKKGNPRPPENRRAT